MLGLIERYESAIASVAYERIEDHVLSTCTGEWGKPMLEELRSWMTDNVVPWMMHVYARGASTRSYVFSCTHYIRLTTSQLKRLKVCFMEQDRALTFISTRHFAIYGPSNSYLTRMMLLTSSEEHQRYSTLSSTFRTLWVHCRTSEIAFNGSTSAPTLSEHSANRV